MTVLVWTAFALAASGVLGARFWFVRLVELEFERHHDDWLKDGRPVGGRGSRRESSFWKSGFSTQSVFGDWLLTTPGWAKAEVDAIRSLKLFRLWAGVLMIGLVALIGVGVFGT